MASKDKVAPTLAVTTPKKGGNAVAVNQNLVLIFNENIQVGTGNIVISNGKGDEQTISMISSPSHYAIIGKTLVINPARDLLSNTHYSVKIDRNAIADLSGNKYAGIDNATTLSFDTVDTLAPVLSRSSSTIKQNGIAPSDNISLTFSEKIQAGRGNITLVAGNDTRTIPISDKQISISGNTLIFNPSADFNVNSSYALHLDAGAINDAALTPNAISAIDLNFKTLVNGDKQAPVLQKYSDKGEVSDNLQLVFQEPIKLGKGNFTLNDGTTQIIIPASDTKQVSIQNNVLTINPSQNLNPEKMYTLISPKGILTDIVGNAFAGLSTRNAFSFDTHDITSPTLIITDDKGALTNSSILYTFTLSEASNNFTSADILVTGGTKGQFLELSPTIYSLHVTPEIDSLMPVKVNVAAKVFTDLVGNDNVAAQQNSQAVDTVAPTVIISAEKPVSLNSAVTYTFTLSEASQTFSADIITVTGAEKGVFKALNSTIYSLNVVPNANSITPINVEVASGEFTDFAGNGNIGSEKASQAIDTLAPTLVGTTPVNQSIDVAKNSNISLFFNENISAGSGDFIISNGVDSQTISVKDSTQVFINNKVITINPTNDLVENSQYSVTFSQGVITDKSGNAFVGLTLPTQFTLKTQLTATTTKDTAGQAQTFVDKLNAKALDGYLKGATVFADKNGNGIQDPGEASAITDEYGNFELTDPEGSLVLSGGTDLSTGKPFSGTLRAPEGSSVVTPLTTVQQGFIDAGQTPEQAEKSVAKAFGFDSEKLDLTTYDPIAEIVKTGTSSETQSIAAQIMASSAQIANFLVTTSQVLQGAAGGSDNLSQVNASNALIKSLVTAISKDESTGDGKIDLADAALLNIVIVDGAKEVQKSASSTDVPNFDAENFIAKMDKMSATLTEVLKSAADNISAAVANSKDGNGLALLGNLDKVSSFVQNNAGQSLQDVVVKFDIKNPNAIDVALRAQKDAFTGDAATKAIQDVVVDTQKSVGEVIAADATAKKAIEDARIAAEKAAIEKVAAEQKAIEDARIAAEQAAIEKAAAEQKAIEDARIAAEKVAKEQKALEDIARQKAINDENARLQAIEDARDRTPPSITINDISSADTRAIGLTKYKILSITGTVSDNVAVSSVQIYDGQNLLSGSAIVTNSQWTYLTPELLDGPHGFRAKALDSSGNSNFSDLLRVNIDSIAPIISTAALTYKDDVGSVTGSTSTAPITDDTKPGVNIGASVTDTPVLYVDGTSVAATYDSATGTLTPTSPLGEGTHALTYILTDGAGNSSTSPALNVTVDTTAPTISTATPTYKDDVGSVTGSTSTAPTTNDTTPGVNIGASVTDTPMLYVDGTSVAATYDSATGTLTPTSPLGEGTHALTYTLTDGAGNSSTSPALNVTVDTTAPTISTATPPTYKDGASVVISTNTLSNTYDNAPGVNIGVGLTDIPKLYMDGKLVDAMYDSRTGTLTPGENLAPGSHKLRYTLTDAAGNESIPSNSLVINVLRKVTIDNVSSANQPLFISGRAEANAKVALALNNNVTVNVNADHNGNWTYDGSVRYIMIRKTLQPLTDGNSAFDANGILTIGDVSIYGISNNKFSPLLSAVTASSPSGFINGWDPRTLKGSIIDNNYTTDTSFAEAWGKEISINGGNAWVQIDLGAVYPISKITVFARDAFGARLNNAQIFTSVNDMSQKSKVELNVDTNINVLTPITNLINTSIALQQVDFQSLIQTITATETVSSLTNSSNATVNNNATSGNDSITGSSGADFIFGGMGNDTLTGREGLDHIQGGEGADLIFGGIGGSDIIGAGLEGDFLSGDAGDDTLYGSAGSDYIQGGAGSDSIIGGLGDDFISGGLGDDTIYGGGNSQWGGDIVSYHNSPSAVSVNLGLGGSTSSATGGEGNDVLYQIEGVEGSDFNDSIVGSLSDEFLFGSQGNDTILGGGGSDHLQGGEGSDSITGESGDDFISGDQGNDLINGGDGSDHIQGGEGSDSINGGSGDDFISGGLGDDTIYGGGNSQWGGDIVSYHNSSSAVSVSLGIGGGTGSATGGEGNDIIYQIEGVEGSDFNDSIVGSLSDEFLFGSQGNDTILGGGGSDDLQGGEGSDSIIGGSGDDFISGDQGNDILIGGGGSDHIHGGEGSDSITAVGSGDNFLSGDQGNDSINGGDGSDHIQGGEGSDLISGGSGDDFISGGEGIDILTGGIGHDIFLFNLGFQSISGSSATDVITDFVHGEDIFDFGIPSSGRQFVNNTEAVSNLTTLLTAVNTINNTAPNNTDRKILFYFGVIASDSYLVTEDDAGVINNIIKLSGVTTITSTDILGL